MSEYPDMDTVYQAGTDEIEAFISSSWDAFLDDAARLIAIDSSFDGAHAAAGAPFGPGPRAALGEALRIARRIGLQTCDGDGYAGYADLPGASGQQLGVIGHVDVVPAGIGWTFPPFELTRKEGMLVGRGVLDDKVPLLSALYALKFWMDKGVSLRHDIRFIFGCNEESGMAEVPYYLARHRAPDFLFTPDAEFPLCYGEKGLFGVTLEADMPCAAVTGFEGGVASNAVPARAQAVLGIGVDRLPDARHIAVRPHEKGALVEAHGISGHASTPEGTRNAIGVLARYLSTCGACSLEERAWFSAVADLAESTDGSAAGVAASDADFGPLTSVVGLMRGGVGHYELTVDVRFPASVAGTDLESAFASYAERIGAKACVTRNQEPFVVDPETKPVQALLAAYSRETGRSARPFTMGGATYAREFPHAVSFGPADGEADVVADWVGGMHGADEGTSEEAVKRAMRIYIRAFGNLACVNDLRN